MYQRKWIDVSVIHAPWDVRYAITYGISNISMPNVNYILSSREGEGFLYEDRNQRSVWAKVKFVRRDNIDREKYTVTCLVKSLHRTK